MSTASPVFQTIKKVLYPPLQRKIGIVDGLDNLPQTGGFIIAANHVDFLDGFYIAAAVGLVRESATYFLTETNNYWWSTVTIRIPSDRRGEIVDTATRFLRGGEAICNFIEGQRNDADTLLPGKLGTARMAIQAGVPVLPVGITCSPGRNMAQSIQYFASKNHPVKLRIGRPLALPKKADPTTAELTSTTRQILAAMAPLCLKKLPF